MPVDSRLKPRSPPAHRLRRAFRCGFESRRPHPRGARPCARLEGWPLLHALCPSFDTLAEFLIGPRGACHRARIRATRRRGPGGKLLQDEVRILHGLPGVTKTYISDPAARCARVLHESFAQQRAWGTPDARCTRSLACESRKHTSVITTGSPETPGAPTRNGFNGLLRALPGDELVLSPSSAD